MSVVKVEMAAPQWGRGGTYGRVYWNCGRVWRSCKCRTVRYPFGYDTWGYIGVVSTW